MSDCKGIIIMVVIVLTHGSKVPASKNILAPVSGLPLSRAQAIGERQGLQKEVTHPRPSGPIASEAGRLHPQAASVLHMIIKPAPAWHA